jgi:hypothetical protein
MEYETYAAALIAHPEACVCIHKSSGEFFVMPSRAGTYLGDDCEFANPADHCSTLAEFLAAGYLLSNSDRILTAAGVVIVSDAFMFNRKNHKRKGDKNRFILSAAAIGGASKIPEVSEMKEIDWSKMPEGATHYGIHGCDNLIFIKKDRLVHLVFRDGNWSLSPFNHHDWIEPIPALCTEYVKIEDDGAFPVWDLKPMLESGVLYSKRSDGLYRQYKHSSSLVRDFLDYGVYRKTVAPVDERQEFIDAVYAALPKDEFCLDVIGCLFDAGFRKPE